MDSLLADTLNGLVLAGFFFLLVHSLVRRSRLTDSARPVAPHGLGGGLLCIAVYALAMGLLSLAACANMVIHLMAAANNDPTLAELIRYAGPGLLGFGLFVLATWHLAFGRTVRSPVLAAVALWLGGPVFETVVPLFFHTAVDLRFVLIYSAVSAAASLYLVISARARHTYGFGS